MKNPEQVAASNGLLLFNFFFMVVSVAPVDGLVVRGIAPFRGDEFSETVKYRLPAVIVWAVSAISPGVANQHLKRGFQFL